MSNSSWYWWCNGCLKQEIILEERSKSNDFKDIGISFRNKGKLFEAIPYFAIEIISERNNTRCMDCDRWHNENVNYEHDFKGYDIPKCDNDKHNNIDKKLVYFEKKAIVFIDKVFCPDKPEYNKNDGIYHTYFFSGWRAEKTDGPEKIISTVYFSGENGRRYGKYSPYFYEGYPFDELCKWIQKIDKEKGKAHNEPGEK